MKEYRDTYGEDRDGNRGVLCYEYEIEKADEEEIKDEILANLTDEGYDDEIEIHLLSALTDELIEFTVDIADYITEEEFKGAKNAEYNN